MIRVVSVLTVIDVLIAAASVRKMMMPRVPTQAPMVRDAVVSAISVTRSAPAGTIILNTRLSVQTVSAGHMRRKPLKTKPFLEIRNILSH